MNSAIIRKTLRDTLPLFLGLTAGLILFEVLFVRAIGEVPADLAVAWLRQPMVQRFLKVLIGADLSENITATGLMTIGFAHPLLFTLNWTMLLTTCTRVVVGEIDRGTADLLLTLPVSRGGLYCSVCVVWMLCGVPMSMAPLAGIALGQRLFPLWEPVQLEPLAILSANLFAMYLAVGAGAMLASSFLSRRGPAIAVVLAVLLFSFLLNFLAQFWSAIDKISFLGVLRYYQPLPVVRTGEWPIANVSILLIGAFLAWSVGMWRFMRRDIPAA